jgi:hypothetical protein
VCSILVAESYGNSQVTFVENTATFDENGNPVTSPAAQSDRINSEAWEPLEKLAKGEVRWACVARIIE